MVTLSLGRSESLQSMTTKVKASYTSGKSGSTATFCQRIDLSNTPLTVFSVFSPFDIVLWPFTPPWSTNLLFFEHVCIYVNAPYLGPSSQMTQCNPGYELHYFYPANPNLKSPFNQPDSRRIRIHDPPNHVSMTDVLYKYFLYCLELIVVLTGHGRCEVPFHFNGGGQSKRWRPSYYVACDSNARCTFGVLQWVMNWM